jgi:predicted AlkP superfamily pyrophosphatase or phosphodiesterase
MYRTTDNDASNFSDRDTYSNDGRTYSDDESDDGRPSAELLEGDRGILEDEEERERLLMEKNKIKAGKREKADRRNGRRRDRKRRAGQGETSQLMYEMEEGVGALSTSISSNSSESDEQRLIATATQRKTRRARVWRRLCIYSAILILFVVLLLVAYRLSSSKPKKSTVALASNGTSMFAPTTILISLDGFRADFLYRGLTPTLNRFIADGISPKYMLPSFPSVTFPNHYTMATGLYPEAHGIVSNKFWDPSLEREFTYGHPDQSMQPFWWGGEPLWVTAEKQDVRVAVHMWPGSEAHILNIEPTYVDKFNGSEALPVKVDRILGLLDLPGPEDVGAKAGMPRPQLIAAYVPNVDSDGHKYGPNSTEIRQTIQEADGMIDAILKGLQMRNLTDIVNVVVVSDHGMATTDVERLIQLEDLIDPNKLSHIDGWPLYGLRPKKIEDLDRLHKQLKEKAKINPNIDVYLRDKDMPERYHFSHNKRIAPLWIVPKAGWAIVTKEEFDVENGKKNGKVYHPRGLHGYDHEHPLMRAIFVARGPAFPHKANSRMKPFQNIELYNIVCDSIGVKPAPNNGTLRLPLKPVGLHTDPDTPPNETPPDPVGNTTFLATTSFLPSLSSLATLASGLDETTSWESQSGPIPSLTTSARPSASSVSHWWDWFTDKADKVEEWVEDFIGGLQNKPTPTSDASR